MKRSIRYVAVVVAVFMSWAVTSGVLWPGTAAVRVGLRDTSGIYLTSSALWLSGGKTERRPGHVTCPETASVLLRPVFPNSPLPKPRQPSVTLHYGELALRFTSASPQVDSLCTLVSQRGALPVIIDFRAASGAGLTGASRQVAASVTTARLEIIPTRTDIRRCDFFLMKALNHGDLIDQTKPLPDGTNECYLNKPTISETRGLSARWSIPGFEEYTPDERGVRVYKTRPLTYYTDLNSLLETSDASSIDSAVIDCLENYIHRTVIENLPAITPIGLVQVPLGT